MPQPRPKLDIQAEGVVDLAHMAARDFVRICVPFALYDAMRWRAVFPAKASFIRAKLQGVNFYKAELHEADFSEAEMQRSNFLLAKMRRATFFKSNLRAISIQRADLRGAHFEDCDANGADFGSADLSVARFSFCGLEGADFEQSKLDWGRVHKNLAGASMRSASLTGAHLYAECSGVDFSGASMTGAMLEGASFGGRSFFCIVEKVGRPPSLSFAWLGLLQPTFDASKEPRADSVAIRFPGAIMSQLKGLDTPLRYVRLSGVSRDDCLQKLPSAANTRSSEIVELIQDFVAQIRDLSVHEIEEVIWPIELEPVLKSAFDASHVARATRTVTLLRVGIGRVEFSSPNGAAWMDQGTLESFTRLSKDAQLPAHRDDLSEWKTTMEGELSRVEPRGNYFGAWLNDRAKWSVWNELEKATPSVSK